MKLLKLLVYVQVYIMDYYIMDYYIMNKEMVECDVYRFVTSEPESEVSDST